MSAPEDGRCIGIGDAAVEDERSTDRDAALLIALTCLGERRRESQFVEVVQCGFRR